MLAIEPRASHSGNEELRAVGVGPSIGHAQKVGLGVLELKVLIGKLLAVDGDTPSAVMVGKVTTLAHELGNDAMETAALVGILLGIIADTEGAEVLGSLRDHIRMELKDDTAERVAVSSDIEKAAGFGHGFLMDAR